MCAFFCSINSMGQKNALSQRGKATYYSKRATGARTSSGVRLHHDSLTCAHRTYPFGTKLKVTNLSNKKYTIVTVTDRGPYGKGKIIDLTYRAAQEIGIISQGVAMVEVELYNEDIYPIRPEEMKFTPFEFDFVDTETDLIKVDGVHSVWQRKKIEHKDSDTNKVQEQSKHTEYNKKTASAK